jgi:hypothetical protein
MAKKNVTLPPKDNGEPRRHKLPTTTTGKGKTTNIQRLVLGKDPYTGKAPTWDPFVHESKDRGGGSPKGP